ncbi:glutathione S-transferase 1-like [Paramacrobiotus metropolitanus]|uniref:glutathione S-transferase 1-like n=1 Tax=Paramacrobiotus metropolitanus TaxID=2943436 RepID=UPI002445D529|nr:glutathione S-transferase 1-like [Paramacrobiotus metropolitanus]XP_055346025.1 glutathione S-transferase 1-like [Paramacrobiotus metropolitanus]
MPNYKLMYWEGARGRGEYVRLLLTAIGQKWEEVPVAFQDWPSLKSNTPFGQLPILEVDGQKLAQTSAIVNFLARRYGLAGENEWEQALVESVVAATSDIFTAMGKVVMSPEGQKATEGQKYQQEIFNPALKYWEKFISEHGTNGYTVGNKITAADIAIYNVLDSTLLLNLTTKDFIDGFPKVKEVVNKVRSHDKLSGYAKKH